MSGAEAHQHPHPWAEHGAGTGTYPKCAPRCCLPPLFILPRYKQCPESNDTTRHVHVTKGYLGSINVVSVRLEKSWFVVLTVGGLPGEGGVWGDDEKSPYTRFIPTPGTGCQLPCHTGSWEVVLSLSRGTQTPLKHFTCVFLFTW